MWVMMWFQARNVAKIIVIDIPISAMIIHLNKSKRRRIVDQDSLPSVIATILMCEEAIRGSSNP